MTVGLLQRNGFEDLGNGVTLNTGNSGGATSTAYNLVSVTGSSTATGDTTGGVALAGTHALRVQALTGSDQVRLDWSGHSDSSGAFRFGFKLNSLSSAVTNIARLVDSAGGTICTVVITASNRIQILNAAAAQVKLFANTLTTGQYYVVYGYCVPGSTTSNGTLLISYFLDLLTSDPAGETQFVGSGTVNTGILPIGEARFVKATAAGKFDGWVDATAYLPGATGLLTPPPDTITFPADPATAGGTFPLPLVSGQIVTTILGPPTGVGTFPLPVVTGVSNPGLTVTVEADNLPPRVKIEIANPGGPSVYVTRTGPNGVAVPVRGGDPALTTSGLIVLYDYEVPYNEPVVYAADDEVFSPVTVTVDQSWLIHPGVPSLSQPVVVLGPVGDEVQASTAGIHQVIGRRSPIVVTDGRRKAPTFPLSVLTDTMAQELGFDDLIADTSVLLLQDVNPRQPRQKYRWISVGDVAMSTPGDFDSDPTRVWSFGCIEVDRPVGDVQAQRTYADLLVEADSYAELKLLYSTYRGVLTGVNGQ